MANTADIEPDDIRQLPTFRAAYSDRTALLMARLANRAYDLFDTDEKSWLAFSDGLARLGFTECTALIDRDVGTAGYVAASGEIIAIVFRGTENDLDWRTNVNASWVGLQGGARVHTGFFQAYWPVRDTLFETVRKMVHQKPRPVYIAGHSLGGALAAMATAELANHEEAAVRDCMAACYTFGGPRVGDASFDQYVKVPLYRVLNGVDLVPFLPPFLFGYRNVGDARYFGLLGFAPLRQAPNVLRQIWRTVFGLIKYIGSGKLANVRDHNVASYVAAILAWTEKNRVEVRERRAETADPEISAAASETKIPEPPSRPRPTR